MYELHCTISKQRTTVTTKQNKHRNKTGIIISTDTSTLLLLYCNLTHYDGRDSTPTFISNNLLIGAIMNLFQKLQKTSEYKTIPDARAADEETTAVPFGTNTRTMTTGRRSSTWLVFQFAGALLLLVAGGGTVWMLQTTDGGLTTTAMERNSDNTGSVQCCKKQDAINCEYINISNYCKVNPTNGYKGSCHVDIQGNGCCVEEEVGIQHWFECN